MRLYKCRCSSVGSSISSYRDNIKQEKVFLGDGLMYFDFEKALPETMACPHTEMEALGEEAAAAVLLLQRHQ